MAEGFLKSFDADLMVFSAGTRPAEFVHPIAITVMKEVGIDISRNKPKNINAFINDSFDFVITVCDNAKETCPVFLGKVEKHLHIGFEDPAEAIGSLEQKTAEFRSVRDKIKNAFHSFYLDEIKQD